jgi:protein tyrosine phosphatase (PTP) superfamily phosphohydrolase (DUF442 family)
VKPRESVHLSPLTPPSSPPASVPPKAGAKADERDVPLDIPGFALAKPRVASGQRPFPDGIDWLKARGYRTVLHIREPGEDNSAARRQFEAKGLRYLTLEVSPTTLTRELATRFDELVSDSANLPLFVWDRDGSLLGGLWYLHFRVREGLSAERAREEAQRLGFDPDADNRHRTMWIAVQKLAPPS